MLQEITTPQQLAEKNSSNANYKFDSLDFLANHNFKIDFNQESEYKKGLVQRDFDLLKEYEQAFNSRNEEKPKVGDALLLPDGHTVYFCYAWNDSTQTTPYGSFNLSKSGFVSHSGGLDSGVNNNDIYLSEEKTLLNIWFSHSGYLKANSAIHAAIKVRVWKTKKDADLSGVPQIKEREKQKLIAKSETITRINGNGQEYVLHMPEIMIVLPHDGYKSKCVAGNSFTLAGLKFTVDHWDKAKTQPMTKAEIDNLLKSYAFEAVFYDNATYKNVLSLTATTPDHKNRYTHLK